MTVRFNVYNCHSNHKFQSSGWFYRWIRGLCDLFVSYIVLLIRHTISTWVESKSVLLALITLCRIQTTQHVCDFCTAVVKMVRVDRQTKKQNRIAFKCDCGLWCSLQWRFVLQSLSNASASALRVEYLWVVYVVLHQMFKRALWSAVFPTACQ